VFVPRLPILAAKESRSVGASTILISGADPENSEKWGYPDCTV